MTGVQTCALDRKSTRLNSSHTIISYAVFCLKKKKLKHGFDGFLAVPLDLSRLSLGVRVRCEPCGGGAAGVATWLRLGKLIVSFFFLRIRRPPKSTLFPSPPPFR